MSDVAIRIRGLGKQYRLGVRRYDSLRERLADLASFSRRRSDGNGVEENRIWALHDVSFDVPHGTVVGIIGRNGAGKSTLLKILSRVTRPTLGKVDIWGRVGALLEVGTGFHSELTGRENVFLNGAILGMSKPEIAAKFDEIVAFAEVEKFIDTPIKRYSSGMHVRLAFAVAAHLEPEILVVDEVLAVGDADFQRKCLGRMNAVSREGRTVLFVSHNIASITQLCHTGVLLNRGQLVMTGDIHSVVNTYLNSGAYNQAEIDFPLDRSKVVQVERLQIQDETGTLASEIDAAKCFQMVIETRAHDDVRGTVTLALNTSEGVRVCYSVCADSLKAYTQFTKGSRQRFVAKFPAGVLNEGFYHFTVWVGPGNTGSYDVAGSPLFRIQNITSTESLVGERKKNRAILRIPLAWQVEIDGSL
jgi:lipopolysaccharide transport system ATP-binding protein